MNFELCHLSPPGTMQSVYSDLNARRLGSSAANLRLLQALADGACSEFLPVLSVVPMQCARVHVLFQVGMREWPFAIM